MTARRVAVLLAIGALLTARGARAQLGELQVGPVFSWSADNGPGAGLVLGVSTGRLAYVGLRWEGFWGETASLDTTYTVCCAIARSVRTDSRVLAADIGIVIPVGNVEIIPGIGLGARFYSQRLRLDSIGFGSGETAIHDDEFVAEPGLAVQVNAGRLAFIPSLQWNLTGVPDRLPVAVEHGGLIASIRVVMTFEVKRIRT